jgi:hypothetical protein
MRAAFLSELWWVVDEMKPEFSLPRPTIKGSEIILSSGFDVKKILSLDVKCRTEGAPPTNLAAHVTRVTLEFEFFAYHLDRSGQRRRGRDA